MAKSLESIHIQAPVRDHITGFIFGVLFTLLPIGFGCIALLDADFIAAIDTDPLILVWLSPFFICEFIGIVSLVGSIKHLRCPPFITVDPSQLTVTLRFWGGETSYDEQYAFRDVVGFELVDARTANELSLELWEELSIKHNWFNAWWNKLLRKSLFWLKNKERALTQQAESDLRTQANDLDPEETFHLKVHLRNNSSRVFKEIYWDDKTEAEIKQRALTESLGKSGH